MSRDASTARSAPRPGASRSLALVVGRRSSSLVYRQVLGITQRPSWPPPPDAVTSAGAKAATEAFAARDGTRPHDAALDFAWSTAATIEPLGRGQDLLPAHLRRTSRRPARRCTSSCSAGARARSGCGWPRCSSGSSREGVEVRVIVDGFGSRPYSATRARCSRRSRRPARRSSSTTCSRSTATGCSPTTSTLDWRQDEVGRADHRKLYVVDGAVAWTGGAGIEDHFENGGFHDVMVRVTGDVVRQAQAAFLTSFRGHGGPLPPDLSRYFPEPADAGSTPIALAQVIPGRLRRGIAGDPRADRRSTRPARRDEPVPHRRGHAPADPRGRAARGEGAASSCPRRRTTTRQRPR